MCIYIYIYICIYIIHRSSNETYQDPCNRYKCASHVNMYDIYTHHTTHIICINTQHWTHRKKNLRLTIFNNLRNTCKYSTLATGYLSGTFLFKHPNEISYRAPPFLWLLGGSLKLLGSSRARDSVPKDEISRSGPLTLVFPGPQGWNKPEIWTQIPDPSPQWNFRPARDEISLLAGKDIRKSWHFPRSGEGASWVNSVGFWCRGESTGRLGGPRGPRIL